VRITLFCPSFGQVGGIETKAENLTAAFRGAGHTVTVIARGERPLSGLENGVPVVRLPFRQLPRRARHLARQVRFTRALPGVIAALRRTVVAQQADVLLTLTISSYAPYISGLARTMPLVLSLEGGETSGTFTTRPRALRDALRRAAHVVACASSLARAACTLAPEVERRLTFIPNGVALDRFGDGAPYPHPRPYVAAVGRLVRQKGFDLLLEAFAGLGSAGAGIDLLIAGEGPERGALEAARGRLGLEGRVHLLGNLDGARVPAFYRGAVLVACPSRWEGLPLVCLEAMASARAVVAAAVDGIPDAVVNDESGLLVPPEDPAAFARALGVLLDDPARREALGRRGRVLARERFSWASVAERYLGVLDGVLQRR
jgi:glycogen(starch) synthase